MAERRRRIGRFRKARAVPVIINGDDFGLRPSIHESIAVLIRRGAMTSASILVLRDPASFHAAARACRDYADRAGFGLHLDLDHWFRFDETRHFGTDESDIDAGYGELVRERRRALHDDIVSQIRTLQDASVPVTHLDGHHHAHLFPGVLEVVVEAMLECGLSRMRFNRAFYRSAESLGRARECVAKNGIRIPDGFVDLADIMRGDAMPCDDDRIIEVMAHTDTTDNEYGRRDQHHYLLAHGACGRGLVTFGAL